MIKLMFEKNGQYFIIEINNKKVLYWDKLHGKIWGGPIQYLPPDDKMFNKIRMSRNKIPLEFIDLCFIPADELEEFNNAKSDEEIRQIILRDCRKNNCKLIDEKII